MRFTMDKIVRDGDPILRQHAATVAFPLSDEHRQLAADMMQYLVISQDDEQNEKYGLRPGVGLAAPQVGYGIQMSALLLPSMTEDDETPYFQGVIVNPVIVSESVKKCALNSGEGCLSVDNDIPGYVPRPQRISVRYQDLDGNVHTLKLRDYPGIVFQHEIDHMKGKLYYDHINKQNPWQPEAGVNYID